MPRPLPKDIGDYLAASLVRRVQRENPQIATESLVDQAVFVRDQVCQRLRGMWLAEQRDQVRAQALWNALIKLECDQLARSASPMDSDDTSEESEAASNSVITTDEPAPPSDSVATTEEPAASSDSSTTTQESEASGEGSPVNPCDFMPPGIAITQESKEQCIGEYSLDPYVAVTIGVLEKSSDAQKLCKSFLEDEYSYIMEEMELGDCGFLILFNHLGEATPSDYSGWGIEFLVDRVMVNVYTFDQYPNSEGWIRATASQIAQNILAQYTP